MTGCRRAFRPAALLTVAAVVGATPVCAGTATADDVRAARYGDWRLRVQNRSAEIIDGNGRPSGWGFYSSCGHSEWGVCEAAASGRYCAFVRNLGVNTRTRKVSAALLLGRSNGYDGRNAYPARPDTEYRVRFSARSDPAEFMRWDLLKTGKYKHTTFVSRRGLEHG